MGMESNVRPLNRNLGFSFERSPRSFSSVRKTIPRAENIASFTVSGQNYYYVRPVWPWGDFFHFSGGLYPIFNLLFLSLSYLWTQLFKKNRNKKREKSPQKVDKI